MFRETETETTLTLSTDPGHRKAILISLFRKKKIKEAFLEKKKNPNKTILAAHYLYGHEVWNVSSYTHLSGLQRVRQEKTCT